MRRPALVSLLLLAACAACLPPASGQTRATCEGSAARRVSHTGTLNVVWGAGTRFFVRVGDRSLEVLIDRPDRVSSDILQGLSARRVRVDGRAARGSETLCADSVTVVEDAAR